ncbi:MAG TPA: MFS transporter, partial [Pseudomonadales bacterium]|nr:MFS transporter [Pseudomonadales bacterium]
VLAWRVLPVPKARAHFNRGERLSYFDRRIFGYIAIAVSMFTAFAIVQQTLGYRLLDLLGLDPKEGAHALAICMMSGAASSLIAQAVWVQGAKWPPDRLLKVGAPVLLAGLILLLVADRLVLFVLALGLIGLGTGLMSPGFASLASLSVHGHEQGGVAGLLGASPGLGFIVGPILGTALYQVEPHLPYLVTVLIVCPLVLYIWSGKHKNTTH